MLAGWLAGIAAAETDEQWIHGINVGRSPEAIALPASVAWQKANELARAEPCAFVVTGSGASMLPLYSAGTLLVLRPVSYAQLQLGQTILYRNRAHRAVAHVLVAKTHDGWRVAGLNNRIHDMEPVVPDNLLGLVVAAIQPTPEPPGNLVALR
ncbi:MAG TPA: hypothetical protein VFJ90_14850 [Candidatus Didemnitutus sp.]|nr:hypothetical protein [Candidatus Didemnitutus sp.]